MSESTESTNTTTEENTMKEAVKKQRNRATKAEVQRRERAILAMMETQGEVDVEGAARAAKIRYTEAGTTLRAMHTKGLVDQRNKLGRRYLFSSTPKGKAYLMGEDVAVEQRPTPIPSVPMGDVLEHIHLGRKLEVIGFRFEKDGKTPIIDLKANGDEVVHVAIVG